MFQLQSKAIKIAPIAAVMLWSFAEQHLSGKRDQKFFESDVVLLQKKQHKSINYFYGSLDKLV